MTRDQRRTRTIELDGWKPKIGDWSDWLDLGSVTNGDWSSKSTITASDQVTQIGSINNETYRSDLKTHQYLRTFALVECDVATFTNVPNEGYQVRCMQE